MTIMTTVYANPITKKPTIAIVATGGTIAGTNASKTAASYTSGVLTAKQLVASVPGIEKLANIKSVQACNIPSQDLNDKYLLKIARTVNELAENPKIDGIVITHGTDTMEETAYFLDLVVHTDKPIVITGAMRPATSMSADGPLNLYNSVAVAANPKSKGKGVLFVMNDTIQAARECTKTNTTNVGTFKSPNTGNMGYVYYGQVKFYTTSTRLHTSSSPFNITEIKSLPKVDIVYCYEGGAKNLVKAAIKDGSKGIVYAGVGDGNPYYGDLATLQQARKDGIAIVMDSRTGSGIVITDDELKDTKYQFNTSDDLNPQKARILLRLALTKTNDFTQIQKYFNEC
ncbi:MAG: type II asparaginase [bacterium]|nr:type II asparaginase [bacterium]